MTIPEMKSVSFIRQDSKEVIAARIARSGFKKTPKKKPLTFPVQSGKIAVDPIPRSRIPLDSVAPFETDGVRIRIEKVWNDIPARCLLNRLGAQVRCQVQEESVKAGSKSPETHKSAV